MASPSRLFALLSGNDCKILFLTWKPNSEFLTFFRLEREYLEDP